MRCVQTIHQTLHTHTPQSELEYSDSEFQTIDMQFLVYTAKITIHLGVNNKMFVKAYPIL